MSSAQTLLSQAVAAFNRGDLRTAADRFERAATTLAAVNPADAVLALESAARVRLMLDQPRHAALAAAKARALHPDSPRVARIAAELADHGGDLESRRAAWREVTERGTDADRRGAHVRLAYLEREAGDPAAAAVQFEHALALETDDIARAELQLEIAVTRTITGEYDAALGMLRQVTADSHVARVSGQLGVIALARGNTDEAWSLAEKARQEAVLRNDVMTYLGAASLLAMIHEQAGRLIDAYDTYIRARESLADLLGEEGRALVQPAVTLFQERVGQPKFDEVWNAWVAMRKAARGS